MMTTGFEQGKRLMLTLRKDDESGNQNFERLNSGTPIDLGIKGLA